MIDRFRFRIFDKETGKYHKQRALWLHYEQTGLEPEIIIEQCTGLKDKNGNLIYEGDIIKYCVNWRNYVLTYTRIVAWDNNTCGFVVLNSKTQVKPLQKWRFPDPSTHIIEIVGNIHKTKKD